MACSCRLLLGDCRDLLPDIGPVDTVLTDPVWPNAPPGMFPDIPDPRALLAETLSLIEARRVVIVLRSDSDPRFLQAVPARWPFFRLQVLSYVVPQYEGRKLGGDEIAYGFGEPIPPGPGRMVIPGWGPKAQTGERPNVGHPCSRPLVHWRWLVHWWSMPGETVLDPFMGSGTTGVACKELERSFIGIEIDQPYFAIAERRIGRAQPPLPGCVDWPDQLALPGE